MLSNLEIKYLGLDAIYLYPHLSDVLHTVVRTEFSCLIVHCHSFCKGRGTRYVALIDIRRLGGMASQRSLAGPQEGVTTEHLNIIHADIGKRYRLNFSGEVNRLTIGNIKECLATASSCSIPQDKMMLKLNGVPLSDDRDVCGAIGICSGCTLAVEHMTHAEPFTYRGVDAYGHDTVMDHMGSLASPLRRQLEVHTVREQQLILERDLSTQQRLLQGTLACMDEELYATRIESQKLESQRAAMESGLAELKLREAQKSKEKERLSLILSEEAEKAEQRLRDLELRRERLRNENEAMRSVAMKKLELEQAKAKLAEEKAQCDAEQRKLDQEQAAFESIARERESQIMAREIELEHANLSQSRLKQELSVQRRIASQQKRLYYRQFGLTPSTPTANSGYQLSAEMPIAGYGAEETFTDDQSNSGMHHFVNTPASYRALAESNLNLFSESIESAVPLQFDANDACAVNIEDQYSILITFDDNSDHLLVFSTLVTAIPTHDEPLCLELLRFILQGLQESSEVPGISASLHKDSIVFSLSIHLPSCQPWALKMLVPPFLQCLQSWRSRVASFMEQRKSSGMQRSHSRTASAAEDGVVLSSGGALSIGVEVTDTFVVNGVSTPCVDGVIVVKASGSAAACGVEQNDCITKVDGTLVRSKEAFRDCIVSHLRRQSQVPIELELKRRDDVLKLMVR